MNTSIWTAPGDFPTFPRLENDRKVDVLIIGGGLTGLLTAHRLHAQGVNYLLIEADRIFRGVSRNTTAKITAQHGLIYGKIFRRFGPDAAYLYWQANQAALEDYQTLSQTLDFSFAWKDSYLYTTGSPAPLEQELEAMLAAGIPGESASGLKLPIPVTASLRMRHQAQFNPSQFVSQIAGKLNICEQTAAKAFHGNTVHTDRGKITAEKIIVATHFPLLNKHGSYFLKLYQQRSYVLALENAADVDGMYLGIDGDGLSFRNYGDVLLLGGGSHRTGKPSAGWAPLEAFAQAHYPQARAVARWATQDCMTLDGIPYIGQYSRSTPNLFVATGFNKWGMTSSMAAANLLTDLVLDRENPYTALFSPSRSILRPQLFTNALDSTVNLLTPTRPRCPHLGCALKWNPQEHSWDCPCHGSRFSEDGTLLNNPATGDLKFPE